MHSVHDPKQQIGISPYNVPDQQVEFLSLLPQIVKVRITNKIRSKMSKIIMLQR